MTENHDLFKALSDPTRLRIACLLTAGQLCVCDLTELLDLPQSTVSRHMAKLKNAGLVTDQRSGRWVHYRLAETSGTVEAALRQLLQSIVNNGIFAIDQARLAKYSRIQTCD